jgi:hypothetical protein
VPVSDSGRPGPHFPWSLRGELREDRQAVLAAYPRIDLNDAIILALADGFADKPRATFGAMNAVLAAKLPGYVRPNFYAIIPGSKHGA